CPRRARRAAAEAHGWRAAHPRQPAAAVPGIARGNAGADRDAARRRAADGDAGRRHRHAGAAGPVPRQHELAAAGRPETGRCARPAGAAGREDAGMKLLEWATLDAAQRAGLLRRPGRATSAATTTLVAGILDGVAARGDAAVREYALRLDGVDIDGLAVDPADIDAATAGLPARLAEAMAAAAARIETFHRAGMQQGYAIETAPGVQCGRIVRPIRRVGLYVPAGSAPLPSTALMLGIPARLAGCEDVVLCTPPRADGGADPLVLAAAALCGIRRGFRTGGAQASAAMAHGTGSVPACDKVFGPGNAYVTEAKQQVA